MAARELEREEHIKRQRLESIGVAALVFGHCRGCHALV